MKIAKFLAVTIVLSVFTLGAAAEVAVLKLPYGAALDKAGNLLISCHGSNSVVVMDRAGNKLREFGSDKLNRPSGLTIDGKGRILVANTGKGEVVLFDAKGKFLAAGGGLNKPQDVAVGPGGLVYVADTGGSRIAVFDSQLEELAFTVDKVNTPSANKAMLKNPAGIAVAGKKLFICDTGNRRLLIVPAPTKAGQDLKPTVVTADGMMPWHVAVAANDRFYVTSPGRVIGFNAKGKQFGEFRATAVRMWFDPKAIVLDAKGNVFCVDRCTRRVLGTTADLFDAEPKRSLKREADNTTTATIEWTTLTPVATVLRHGPTEECKLEYRSDKPTKKHRVVLKGLKPAIRYHYHAGEPVIAIPKTTPRRTLALEIQTQSYGLLSSGNFSGEYAFATLPVAGKTDWVYMPTVVLVYKNVSFPPGKDGKKPPNRVLSDKDIKLLKSEMEKYRLWAWRHSSLKLNFDWTYVIVEEPRMSNMMGGYHPKMIDDMVMGTQAQGKDLHNFWYGVVCGTAGWYAHYLAGTVSASDGSKYELGCCFTAFGPGTKPGWYWFPTHEHGHLVHSMVMCSGNPHFAFPDAPWTLPGQFGENFSFLAYNYRVQDVRFWMTIKKGVINQSIDADGNGVPDDDPRVPLDQKRFGWTKKMGGDCFKRIMAGGRTPGYPKGTFTDFEGRTHKLNVGELNWVNRKIAKATPTLDGKLGKGEWKELYLLPNVPTPKPPQGLKAKVYVAWDDGHYYIAVKSNRQAVLGFDLDANNDGWFHSRDNLRCSVRPATDKKKDEVWAAIWDFYKNRIQPTGLWYKKAYKPGDIKAATGKDGDWYVVEVAIPARPKVKIAPGKGAKFGLRVYLSNAVKGQDFNVGFFDGEDFVYDLTCTEK